MVFLQLLLWTMVQQRLQTSPYQIRTEDIQKKKLRDLLKRLRRTRWLMSREGINLRLEIIKSNLYNRLIVYSRMKRSKTSCLNQILNQLEAVKALRSISHLSQIQMLLITNMISKELGMRNYSI